MLYGCLGLQIFTPLRCMKGSSLPLTVMRGLRTRRAGHTLSGASATDTRPLKHNDNSFPDPVSRILYNENPLKFRRNNANRMRSIFKLQ